MASQGAAPQAEAPAPQPGRHHLQVLREVFGLQTFRGRQFEAIAATLLGQDVLTILPTGAGKSLTFQFPPHAAAKPCFTVVIGPLIALMRDQVDKCQEKGIEAVVFNSDTPDQLKQRLCSDIISDEPSVRLLYTTPESLQQPRLRDALKMASEQGTLLSFAIDESHCVCEWGADFRPAYLNLCTLRDDFPHVPISACTASCTPDVQRGICKLLRMRDPCIIKSSFNRPNIAYHVRYKDLLGNGSDEEVLADLVDFVRTKEREGGAGIIYARTRASCDWLARALQDLDMEVGCFHAGRDAQSRARVQREWSEGAINVVVATIAFGLGIDRADVRWVAHWNASSSVEAFYQESGRAGRDGLPSLSVLWASHSDLQASQRMEHSARVGAARHMSGLCMEPGCRRKKLLAYFSESRGGCGESPGELACDWCRDGGAAVRRCLNALERKQQQPQNCSVADAMRGRMQVQAAQEGQQQQDGPGAQGGAGAGGAGVMSRVVGGGWGTAHDMEASLAAASSSSSQPGGAGGAQPLQHRYTSPGSHGGGGGATAAAVMMTPRGSTPGGGGTLSQSPAAGSLLSLSPSASSPQPPWSAVALQPMVAASHQQHQQQQVQQGPARMPSLMQRGSAQEAANAAQRPSPGSVGGSGMLAGQSAAWQPERGGGGGGGPVHAVHAQALPSGGAVNPAAAHQHCQQQQQQQLRATQLQRKRKASDGGQAAKGEGSAEGPDGDSSDAAAGLGMGKRLPHSTGQGVQQGVYPQLHTSAPQLGIIPRFTPLAHRPPAVTPPGPGSYASPYFPTTPPAPTALAQYQQQQQQQQQQPPHQYAPHSSLGSAPPAAAAARLPLQPLAQHPAPPQHPSHTPPPPAHKAVVAPASGGAAAASRSSGGGGGGMQDGSGVTGASLWRGSGGSMSGASVGAGGGGGGAAVGPGSGASTKFVRQPFRPPQRVAPR